MATPTSSEGSQKTVQYTYRFLFGNGSSKEFVLRLDPDTLALQQTPPESYPFWTELEYKKCPNCPLDPARHPHCPVAVNVIDVIEFFRNRYSYEAVEVVVETANRTYSKKTVLQEGVSSFLGVFMVASGCPVLNKLRPMLATHLPFMTSDESTYRTISMYLMAQYFLHREGRRADWDLTNLLGFLREIHETNAAFCRRLQSLRVRDASLNALTILNAMGEIASLSLEADDLSRWERLFSEPYGIDPRD